jgi:hypothetical protein
MANNVTDFNWTSVSTLDELKTHAIDFLKGKYSTSPWHLGAVNRETVPLLGDLIKLNSLGYISTQGQPAEYTYPVRHYKTGKTYRNELGNKVANVQYGYIDGILDARKYPLNKLIYEMANELTVCAAIYVYSTNMSYVINLPTNSDTSDGIYTLTKTISDKTGNVEIETRLYLNDLYGIAEEITSQIFNSDLHKEIIENCMAITFVHNIEPTKEKPDIGSGLEKKLIRILESIRPSAKNNTAKNNYKGGSRTKKRYNKLMRTKKHKYNKLMSTRKYKYNN